MSSSAGIARKAEATRCQINVEFVFSDALPVREANAVRRLLSVKHGLRLRTDPDGDIVGILKGLGLDSSGLFNSVIVVR